MATDIKRYTLNDMFSTTSELVGALWKPSLIAGAIAFLPTSIMYLISFRWLFAALGSFMELAQKHAEGPEVLNALTTLIAPYALMFGAAFLYTLTYMYISAFNTRLAFDRLQKKRSAVADVLRDTLALVPRMIGQSVIIGSLVLTAMLVYYALFFAGLFGWIQDGGIANRHTVFFILGCILWVIVLLASMLWLTTKSAFALPAIVHDESIGAFESIGRSFSLVKGSFWRTFGLMTLASIILSFAVGIVTGPVIFILILPGYIEMIKSILAGNNDYFTAFPKLFGNLVWGLGVSMYLQAVAISIVYPVFQSLLFLDLSAREKARKS